MASRVSRPSSRVRKKLMAATPTTPPSVDGERDDPLAGRIPVEPPGELLVRELGRPDPRSSATSDARRSGEYATSLEAHSSVAVPSAALNIRRACVPGDRVLDAIRSQAPASTSSKVRAEYGSTL